MSADAAQNPRNGEIASAINTPHTPTGRQPSNPPQFTALTPTDTKAAPTSPPTSAWLELAGSPRSHVTTFHVTAPVSPAPTTATSCDVGTFTIVAMVLATAAPSRSGPIMLQTAARSTAGSGRPARVAIRVAIALAASCSPFVTANANAMTRARPNPVISSAPPIERPPPGRSVAR